MRFKTIMTSVIPAAILMFSGRNLLAQVAPAAKLGGLPIGITAGFSDYNIDYGPGRRMQGLVAEASLGLFHGLGIDGSARAIFMNTPSQITRMQQNTYLGGVFYETPGIWKIRPFARFAGGIGTIEFPSRNPLYTRDSYNVYALSGGAEYPITPKVFVRVEYEHQAWHHYHSLNDLTPSGWTVGATQRLDPGCFI
jgi:opacity protein-like surface antigen